MAALGQILAQWGPTIVRNLPHIVLGGAELYRAYRASCDSDQEKKAVDEAMKLLEQNRDDIDKLLEDRKQMMTMLEGLSLLMERMTQHYGSHGSGSFPPSQCCQHAVDPPCCHEHHGPRRPSGCHHHGPRGSSGCHHHGPRGPSGCHHHGARGPSGCHHHGPRGPSNSDFSKNLKGSSGNSCSPHVEVLQSQGSFCQELSDDEESGASSCQPSSSQGSWRVCDVCRSNFNMTKRRPTILVCGHTFCRECLGQVARRGPLLCPTCRTHESRHPADLPSNVVLMIALEENGKSKNGTEANGDIDDWKKTSTFLEEEEELMMQMALHMSMRKKGAGNNQDEDDWKNSTLQEEEDVLVQMAVHLSLNPE